MVANLKSQRNATTIRFNDEYTRNVVYTAAQMQGQSLTGFILSAIRDKAEAVIKERKQTMQEIESIVLSPRASAEFLETLLNPPEPNDALLVRRLGDTVVAPFAPAGARFESPSVIR